MLFRSHSTFRLELFSEEWLENFLTFAALSLPAFGAAIGGIRTHREYSRLAKRSKNMEQVLEELDESFKRISRQGLNQSEGLESLLKQTEELMLNEVQNWMTLLKFSEIELG